MLIGGLQKCSLIDYPGEIAAVIFTRGCNFRCRYCYNPELVYPERYADLIEEKDVAAFLKKRTGMLDAAVITGGEPSVQEDLLELIRRISGMGFKVKLDTNGSRPEILEKAVGFLDYIAMDVKAPLHKYPLITGVEPDSGKIKESIATVMGSGKDYEFRTTVAGNMFTPEDIELMGELIEGAGLHFLQNFRPSGKIAAPGLAECSAAELESFRSILCKYAAECRIR